MAKVNLFAVAPLRLFQIFATALRLGLLMFAWLLLAVVHGQAAEDRSKHGPSIAVLLFDTGFQATAQGFEDRLRELGFRPGDNLQLDVHDLQRDLSRIPPLLERLAATHDLILTTTTPVVRRVQQHPAGNQLPLLFTLVASPLESKVVDSLARPGSNVSGISHIAFELLSRRLQLFKTAFPEMRKVALFYNHQEQFLQGHVEKFLLPAAAELGIELVSLDVLDARQLQQYERDPGWAEVDGLLMLPDPLQVSMFDQLASLSRRHRLPLMVLDNHLLARGGVMGYSPDFYDVGSQAAEMAASILRGADISQMPVQNPRRVLLLVSIREARRLQLSPSTEILRQADEIIR